ncbi:mannitol dehydrogenase family protein [Paraburkholderia phenoliruptrix]|uniref:Altronate oxidoreductase n=2 Tax=Paraburkholderia phenoliruptrix TaxID=252970 RepID=A0A6J5K4H4_9BURK|nr:D-mannonate oxidoreductase [Paraburkholderia phenoliruptrix]AFT86140.1 tagaturonate reductase [Paraburkholderia phenoliruptrix BR3459a]MDR6388832.1 tagaturonate reductase [Paraburkholderia phenoliruptrix]CAB4048690.1 Altronate oxidoreductase [Paraburkholderia phenoliruptrix]
MSEPILQFGTSRFLQAHVALFVAQALGRGEAIGGISVVQTTGNPASEARIAALAQAGSYPVRIRGRENGAVVDTVVQCGAVRAAWVAKRDWAAIRHAVIHDVRVIVSNTGDAGYRLDERDSPAVLALHDEAPHSYPAKLLALLHARWRERPGAGVSIFPCELVASNGDTLRDLVIGLAQRWAQPVPFIAYLSQQCVWVNSLVDRIVSEPIEPVGAVAEPYALWAIERRPGMELPCTHDDIVVTDDLRSYEQLKLFFLNLGHTWLADQWLAQRRNAEETVFDAMNDAALRAGIEAVWEQEVLPVFTAMGLGDRAEQYLASVRERLLNPYLDHRIADIAQNHVEKVRRRIAPLIALADSLAVAPHQTRLRETLARHGLAPAAQAAAS